jgi:hypothetical protein
MPIDHRNPLPAIAGILLACVISLLLWFAIALILHGRTPIW